MTSDLEDTKKRWLVVGICLHTVVAPVLRQYVSKFMDQIYNTLIQTPDKINTQVYPNYLKFYPKTGTRHNLNYEAVNNNINAPRLKKPKDYKIYNPVEFSKLFLATNMAKYVGFDETCDSSALLNIIGRSDTSPIGTVADEVGF